MTRRVKHKKKLYTYCAVYCLRDCACSIRDKPLQFIQCLFTSFRYVRRIYSLSPFSHLEPHFNLHNCCIIYVIYLFVMLFLFLCNEYLTLAVLY